MIELRPFYRMTDEQARELKHEAIADEHLVLAPTHAILKDNDVAGYLSLGGIPLVHGWLHTKRMKARDSYRILEEVRKKLPQHALFSVGQESPLYPYMKRIGAIEYADTTLWVKGLSNG